MMNVPGGPTPAEVMAVSLLKLGVRSGDVAAGLGCGTGTVTREIAKTASYVHFNPINCDGNTTIISRTYFYSILIHN